MQMSDFWQIFSCYRFPARRSLSAFAPSVAAVITQLSNTIIRAIEQDRRVSST